MLPKLVHPTFQAVIPSTKEKIKMRPMLVREEKILLMAKETKEIGEILSAIKQVVNNCIVDNVDVDKLATFDVDYLFVKLASFSISNIARVSYQDLEDEKFYPFDIDLNTVEVKFPEKEDFEVKLSDTVGMKLRYPPAKLYSDDDFKKLLNDENASITDILLLNSIESINDGTKLIDPAVVPKDEFIAYIDTFSSKAYESIRVFFDNQPSLYHQIEWTNSNGTKRVMELKTLSDFFMLR